MLSTNSLFAINISDSMKNNTENANQSKIEKIFTNLNELALNMKKLDLFNKQTINNNSLKIIQEIKKEQNDLEKMLEKLGIHKLDPNNINDINSLSEIINSSVGSNDQMAPMALFDFSILVNVYSIYEYTGTYVISGVSYDYKYVRVVDNKGYVDTKLTKAQLITLVGQVNTTVSNLLSYNFSYGFSSFLGILPYGWAADWILGNIFTALNSYNGSSPVVYNNSNGIYCINMISITDMTYYYIKVSGLWYNCGSRASNIGLARADSFTANISGTPVAWSYWRI